MFVYIIGTSIEWFDKTSWIHQVSTNIPTNMAGIATTLRDALVRCREPDYISDWVMIANNIKLEAVNSGKIFAWPSDDNLLIVNSNTV